MHILCIMHLKINILHQKYALKNVILYEIWNLNYNIEVNKYKNIILFN